MRHFPPPLKREIIKIAQAVRQEGGKAYLVGGCVRDSLLQMPVQDADIEVFHLAPERLKQVLHKNFSVDLVGKAFAVFKIRGWEIDVSIPRRETKIGGGHKGFFIDSNPDISLAEASSRRDFTINAILYDPLEQTLYDPWGGTADVEKKLIRHVSEQFKEDPLRPLRAMQMLARFDFEIDPTTQKICQSLSQAELSKERIYEEWKKMLLRGKKISKGLAFLDAIGWLRFYPELSALVGCPQDPRWHPEGDVFTHTQLCLDAWAKLRDQIDFSEEDLGQDFTQLILGFAVLCHDLGKAVTTQFYDGGIQSPRHELLGVPLTASLMASFTNQTSLIDRITPLVKYHMQPYHLFKEQSSPAAIRRLAVRVDRIDWLSYVCHADYIGCGKEFTLDVPHLKWLLEQAAALQIEKSAPKPFILGRHLMQAGIKPGLAYKKILEDCFEAQIKGIFTDEEQALVFLQDYLKDQPVN